MEIVIDTIEPISLQNFADAHGLVMLISENSARERFHNKSPLSRFMATFKDTICISPKTGHRVEGGGYGDNPVMAMQKYAQEIAGRTLTIRAPVGTNILSSIEVPAGIYFDLEHPDGQNIAFKPEPNQTTAPEYNPEWFSYEPFEPGHYWFYGYTAGEVKSPVQWAMVSINGPVPLFNGHMIFDFRPLHGLFCKALSPHPPTLLRPTPQCTLSGQ